MTAARKPRHTFSAPCSGIAAGNDALQAGVAELVDALDLGSSDESCGGSSPSARTKRLQRLHQGLLENPLTDFFRDRVRRTPAQGVIAARRSYCQSVSRPQGPTKAEDWTPCRSPKPSRRD